ncbi:MAG TPA: hypothetical protein GX708_03105 [Gallicola sp.]|nr:hypothetical protein [Gallicola sp.]
MHLSNQRYEQIKQIVTEVFEDYQICNLPIDVELLAKKMNIEVIKYSKCGLKKQNALLNASNDGLSFYNKKKKKFFYLL